MSGTVVIGAQWGDEGKGKIVDLLAEKFDIVARYQGGNNAGHTVVHGDRSSSSTCCRRASSSRTSCASSATASSSTPRCCAASSTRSRSEAARSTGCASPATPTW